MTVLRLERVLRQFRAGAAALMTGSAPCATFPAMLYPVFPDIAKMRLAIIPSSTAIGIRRIGAMHLPRETVCNNQDYVKKSI